MSVVRNNRRNVQLYQNFWSFFSIFGTNVPATVPLYTYIISETIDSACTALSQCRSARHCRVDIHFFPFSPVAVSSERFYDAVFLFYSSPATHHRSWTTDVATSPKTDSPSPTTTITSSAVTVGWADVRCPEYLQVVARRVVRADYGVPYKHTTKTTK